MDKSKIYAALAAISAVEDDIENETRKQTAHVAALSTSLTTSHQLLIASLGITVAATKAGKSTKSPEPKAQEESNDEDDLGLGDDEDDGGEDEPSLYEQAIKLCEDNSKVSAALMKRELGLTPTKSKPILAELKAKGYIDEKNRTATHPDRAGEGDEDDLGDDDLDLDSDTDTPKTLMELIDDMPDGDDLLISAPFNLLQVLDADRRKFYTGSLVLEDLISPDALAQGAKNGVNRLLVDEINEGAKPPKIKAESVMSDKDIAKYEKNVANWIKIIPHGKGLVTHMMKGKINRDVLRDIKAIAAAVKEGNV